MDSRVGVPQGRIVTLSGCYLGMTHENHAVPARRWLFSYDLPLFFDVLCWWFSQMSAMLARRQELEQRLADIEKKSDGNKQDTRGVFDGWLGDWWYHHVGLSDLSGNGVPTKMTQHGNSSIRKITMFNLMGKSTINRPFSIALLNYQRVRKMMINRQWIFAGYSRRPTTIFMFRLWSESVVSNKKSVPCIFPKPLSQI